MLKYFFFIMIFSLPVLSKQTNFEIQDSLVKISVKEIIEKLDVNEKSLQISVYEHTAAWLISQNITNQLIKKDFQINDSSTSTVELFIKKIEPEYITLNKDSISRNIELNIAFNIIEKNVIQQSDEISYKYSDYIKFENVENIENKSYAFSQGNIPDIPTSFWDKYIEPVVVISAAIVTVIVFFTVRSG